MYNPLTKKWNFVLSRFNKEKNMDQALTIHTDIDENLNKKHNTDKLGTSTCGGKAFAAEQKTREFNIILLIKKVL